MKTQAGALDRITTQDGQVLEVLVERAIETGDGWLIVYSIPSWEEDGEKYYTQEYFYPNSVDYSGIINATGIPVSYKDKGLESFDWRVYQTDTKMQQEIISTFLFRFDEFYRQNTGLYISSRTRGSGKTMLACLIGNEILKRGLNLKFVSVTEYIQASRNGFADTYKDCSVLILDDLGAQDEKQDWIREIIFGLINRRYERNAMTIITSNSDMDSCSQDDRIVSRVLEMTIPLKIPEVPVRKHIANVKAKNFLKTVMNA